MAKDPAFLFYPGDWLGGTMAMSFEEKGIYISLLVLQFNVGHMTYDMMAQYVGHMFGQFWDRYSSKFATDDNNLYYNAKLDKEKMRRKAFTESRYNNKTGKNQYSDKNGHMTYHMETETETNSIVHNKVRNSENNFEKNKPEKNDHEHQKSKTEGHEQFRSPDAQAADLYSRLIRGEYTSKNVNNGSENN